MTVIDLDQLSRAGQIGLALRFHLTGVRVFTAGLSLVGGSIGDVFLSLLACDRVNRRQPTALITSPMHAEVGKLLRNVVDYFLLTSHPTRYWRIFLHRSIHCSATHFRHRLGAERYRETMKTGNPWGYFLLNQTHTDRLAEIDPIASEDVDGSPLQPGDVVFFPQRSDFHVMDLDPLVRLAVHFQSLGKHTFTNLAAATNPRYRGQEVIVPGTQPLTLRLHDLLILAQRRRLFLVGNRSGMFDVALFLCPSAKLICFYPREPEWIRMHRLVIDQQTMTAIAPTIGPDVLERVVDINIECFDLTAIAEKIAAMENFRPAFARR